MNSIRTKFALAAVCAVTVIMTAATVLGTVIIRNIGARSTDRLLLLLCETGEKNLDFYFDSVEQSVEMVSAYVESDLDGLDDERLQAHVDRVGHIFGKLTYKTNGILTYYYRIDPAVSRNVKGFWFVRDEEAGFVSRDVTDITLYDTEDTSRLVWFTVPKFTREPVWLPPYITDNLGARVISYNVPVYLDGQFVGVIGIEIDYSTMAEQVDSITLYENGYAFINDAEGNIIYHPRMDVASMETQPKVPQGLLGDSTFIRYNYDGVEKQAVWLKLRNGMRLNVSVPVNEINKDWMDWINEIVLVFVVLLIPFIVFILYRSEQITKPLRELTEVAMQVNAGNYDHTLDYRGKDEVGILTSAFNQLITHLKSYIGDLKNLAYGDALTAVRNKGAFDIFMNNLEEQLQTAEQRPQFAVCIFDCNNLKAINDQFGHEQGDIYLKSACSLICQVFTHSPVFRTGGDEFATILQNNDYQRRDELIGVFDIRCKDVSAASKVPWKRVDVARGLAVYDPKNDQSVHDVVRRADRLMYENKRKSKGRTSERAVGNRD